MKSPHGSGGRRVCRPVLSSEAQVWRAGYRLPRSAERFRAPRRCANAPAAAMTRDGSDRLSVRSRAQPLRRHQWHPSLLHGGGADRRAAGVVAARVPRACVFVAAPGRGARRRGVPRGRARSARLRAFGQARRHLRLRLDQRVPGRCRRRDGTRPLRRRRARLGRHPRVDHGPAVPGTDRRRHRGEHARPPAPDDPAGAVAAPDLRGHTDLHHPVPRARAAPSGC